MLKIRLTWILASVIDLSSLALGSLPNFSKKHELGKNVLKWTLAFQLFEHIQSICLMSS